MYELDEAPDDEDIPEPIVEWQRERGPLVGQWDGPVVAIATVSALALLGFTAAAFMAGRNSVRRQLH